jgi:hypothetical protein
MDTEATETDYPAAAHSMDSEWFAVDRAGHVGYFRTGENGALPDNALCGNDGEELEERLRQIVPPCEVVFVRAGRSPPGVLRTEEHMPTRDVVVGLMFLDTLKPVQEDIEAGRAVAAEASEGVALLLRGLLRARFEQLHQAGACRGCFLEFLFLPRWMERSLSRRGVFCYQVFDWSGLACPYGLHERPRRPLHIDELPPGFRRQVNMVQFDLLFAEAMHLQPVEHVPCHTSWPNAWLDGTGTVIRPVPGSEEQYTAELEELRRRFAGFQVEPPP